MYVTDDIMGVEEVVVVNVVAGVVRPCVCERVKDEMIGWTDELVDVVVVDRRMDMGGALTGGGRQETGVKLSAAGLRLDITEEEEVTAVTAVTAGTVVTGTEVDKAGGAEVDTGPCIWSLGSSLAVSGCDSTEREEWPGSPSLTSS